MHLWKVFRRCRLGRNTPEGRHRLLSIAEPKRARGQIGQMHSLAGLSQRKVERQTAKDIETSTCPGDEDVLCSFEFLKEWKRHAEVPLKQLANALYVARFSY